MVLALPLGMGAIRQQQIFNSRAQSVDVQFLTKETSGIAESCVAFKDGNPITTCKTIR